MEQSASVGVAGQEKPKGFQLNLCTKGHCFLCLQKQNLQNGNFQCKPEHGEIHSLPLSTSISLKHLCRHLNINVGKIATEVIKTPALIERMGLASMENSDMKVNLCGICGSIAENFSTLFQEFERISLEIDNSLEKIHKRLLAAEEDSELVNSYQKLMSEEIHSLLLSGYIDELKKEILKKCSTVRINRQESLAPTPPSCSLNSSLAIRQNHVGQSETQVEISEKASTTGYGHNTAQSSSGLRGGREDEKNGNSFKSPTSTPSTPSIQPTSSSAKPFGTRSPTQSVLILPNPPPKPQEIAAVDLISISSDDESEDDVNNDPNNDKENPQTTHAQNNQPIHNSGICNTSNAPEFCSPSPSVVSRTSSVSSTGRKLMPAPEEDPQDLRKKLKFKCKICSESFPRMVDVKQHKQTVHMAPNLRNQSESPSSSKSSRHVDTSPQPPNLSPHGSHQYQTATNVDEKLFPMSIKLSLENLQINPPVEAILASPPPQKLHLKRKYVSDGEDDFSDSNDEEQVQDNLMRGYESDNTCASVRIFPPTESLQSTALQKTKKKSKKYVFDRRTSKFVCPDASCSELFPTKYFAKRHYETVHVSKLDLTRKDTNSAKRLRRGRSFHEGQAMSDEELEEQEDYVIDNTTGKFKCRLTSCPDQFSSKRVADMHYRFTHLSQRPSITSPAMAAPPNTQPKTKPRGRRSKYYVRDESTGKFKCIEQGCSKIFSTTVGAMSHYKTIHLNLRHRCDVCNLEFAHLSYMRKHRETCKRRSKKASTGDMQEIANAIVQKKTTREKISLKSLQNQQSSKTCPSDSDSADDDCFVPTTKTTTPTNAQGMPHWKATMNKLLNRSD